MAKTKIPKIVGWAVHKTDDLSTCAMYNLSEEIAAFDAANRWKANITSLVLHPNAPTVELKLKKNPTNIERLLHATRVAKGYLCDIDTAGARHIRNLLEDAITPWNDSQEGK